MEALLTHCLPRTDQPNVWCRHSTPRTNIESTSAAIDARLCGLQLCEFSMGTNQRCAASRWSKPKVGQQRLWALLGLLLWFNFILSYRNLAIIFLRQELRLGSICKYSPGSVGETAGPRDADFFRKRQLWALFGVLL